MKSAMHLMKKMELNTPVKGVAGLLVDGGVTFGAAYGIGQVYHRYSDKFVGKQAARMAAAGGKLAAVAFSAMSGGHQTWMGSVANSIGNAGIAAMGVEMGLRHARAKSGKKAVLISSSAALPPGATEMSSIGALGRAGAGTGLSWDQIEELAQSR